MSTVKAQELNIPDNLANLLDKRAGKPEGYLMNLFADAGKLREAKTEAFKIAMGYEIKHMLMTDKLPTTSKPMTLERFSEIMWVLTLAYTLGTIRFDEDGDLQVGRAIDIGMVTKLMSADEFEFRSGAKIPAEVLIPVIQTLTSEKAIDKVYYDIVGKGLFKKKDLDPAHCMNLAELIMTCSDKLGTEKFWNS